MKKTLRRLVLCIALVSTPFAGNAFADHIGGPGFVPVPYASAFFVGTQAGVPHYGSLDYTLGQLIPSNYDYSDLVLTVQLASGSESSGTVDFVLAPNDSGVPGAPIGTASVAVHWITVPGFSGGDYFAEHTVDFPGASLNAGTWYWLIATSPDVLPFPEDPPYWAISPGLDFPAVWSYNGGPWVSSLNPESFPYESFAYELDGVRESDTFVSAGPPPFGIVPTPEPSSLLLLICGFGMIAVVDRMLRKRPRGSVTACLGRPSIAALHRVISLILWPQPAAADPIELALSGDPRRFAEELFK